MQDDHLKQFSTALILLARVLGDVKDRVILRRIHADMLKFIAAYVRLFRTPHNVAQSIVLHELKGSYESLIRGLEDLGHFQLSRPTPLAQAQRALCHWYVVVLQQHNKKPQKIKEAKVLAYEGMPKASSLKPSIKKRRPASLSDNQQKILSFIRSTPDARTKDIIDEFSVLSNRTVKRNLRELIDAGLVTRRAENKASFYSIGPKSS